MVVPSQRRRRKCTSSRCLFPQHEHTSRVSFFVCSSVFVLVKMPENLHSATSLWSDCSCRSVFFLVVFSLSHSSCVIIAPTRPRWLKVVERDTVRDTRAHISSYFPHMVAEQCLWRSTEKVEDLLVMGSAIWRDLADTEHTRVPDFRHVHLRMFSDTCFF